MTIQSQFPASRPSLLLDFANAKRLDPRVTFTRASTARFYDGSTVAKAEENLLTQSQAFNESAWTKANTTATADQTTAPDGTSTADLIAEAAVTDTHQVFRASNVAITSGLTYTFSIFLKKGTGATAPNIVQLTFVGGQFGTGQYANFNLDTGAVGTNTGVTASIVNAGSGWYRCIITRAATASSTTSAGAIIAFTNNNDGLGRVPSYAGATTSDVFAWGAQLEERSSVTAYTATTTAPITNYIPVLQTAASGQARFDHNPVTGESLGLLIEESRTNALTYSEDFGNAAWTKFATTVSTNSNISPDGTISADTLIANGTSNVHRIQQSFASGSARTFSVYAKARTASFIQILFDADAAPWANFNLATGVVGSTGSNQTATIESVGNGWYRCTVYTSSTTTNGVNVGIVLSATSVRAEINSSSGTVFLWGAQVEAGAFPTSYIQTVAASATRQADAASMTGANFTSWFDATEGTLFADAAYIVSTVTQSLFNINDGSANNTFELGMSSTNRGRVFVNGSAVASLTGTSALSARTALAYRINDFAFVESAGTVSTDTSGAIPVVSQLNIGRRASNDNLVNATVRKLAYYPVRLPDAQLQALTR